MWLRLWAAPLYLGYVGRRLQLPPAKVLSLQLETHRLRQLAWRQQH